MRSILEKNQNKCFICGTYHNLHQHHVFQATNRDKSTKYKLTVTLCADCHTGSKGVHNNRELMDTLHDLAQRKAMEHYGWSVDEFREIFGKNYLKGE